MRLAKRYVQRADYMNFLASEFDFYFTISSSLPTYIGGTYNSKTRVVSMCVDYIIAGSDDLFYSILFHEIAHHLHLVRGIYKKAYYGRSGDKIKYLKKMRGLVEAKADRDGMKLMAIYLPDLKYIKSFSPIRRSVCE